jgi:protein SCO1
MPQLKGIDLGREPAPKLKLNDHRGNVVSLADSRGKFVVLTFLYTTCTDECPLIASKLRSIAK